MEEELIDKVQEVLKRDFPGAALRLETYDGGKISGFLTWTGFGGMEQLARQRKVWAGFQRSLQPEEQRRVTMIMTMTPEEMVVYSEG